MIVYDLLRVASLQGGVSLTPKCANVIADERVPEHIMAQGVRRAHRLDVAVMPGRQDVSAVSSEPPAQIRLDCDDAPLPCFRDAGGNGDGVPVHVNQGAAARLA